MTAAKGAAPASAPVSQAFPALNSTEAVRTKDGTDFEPVVSGINARGLEPAVLAEPAMLPTSSWSMVDEEKAASGHPSPAVPSLSLQDIDGEQLSIQKGHAGKFDHKVIVREASASLAKVQPLGSEFGIHGKAKSTATPGFLPRQTEPRILVQRSTSQGISSLPSPYANR